MPFLPDRRPEEGAENEARPPSPGPGRGRGNSMPWLMIAISGGALSAVFLSGLVTPSPLSFILFFLVPVPLYMVGLAFGWLACAIAALTALALLAAMLGPAAALMHALTTGAPVTWLVHLARQHRPATGASEGEPVDEDGVEWYPEGRLLLWMAGLSALAVVVTLLTLGLSLQDIRADLMNMAERAMRTVGLGTELTEEQKNRFLQTFATLAPLSMVVLWQIVLFLGFRLSVWLTRRFGLSRRPLADFAGMTFPRKALPGLAGVSLLALMPGLVGYLGQVAALALMTAFALLGLAVVHALMRGRPWQPLALGTLYALLLLLTGLVGPALLLLGLAETGFGVREAFLKGGGPPQQT